MKIHRSVFLLTIFLLFNIAPHFKALAENPSERLVYPSQGEDAPEENDARQARTKEVFQQQWEEIILPFMTGRKKDLALTFDDTVRDKSKLSVSLIPCEQGYRRLADLSQVLDMPQVILYGMMDDLKKEGSCWVIHIGQGFKTLEAYLEEETMRTILVWFVPEG